MPDRARPRARAFEDLAARYDAWYDSAGGRVLFALELEAVRPLLGGTGGPRLEVGVGSGRFAAALGLDVGLDPAEAPLLVAQRRGVRVVRGRGEDLPFGDGAFGAVVLVVTLCFAEDPAVVLTEAARVLRPGGRLVIGLVPLDSAWGRSYEARGRAGHAFYRHANFLTLADHRRLLEGAGFRVDESRSTLVQSPDGEPVHERLRHGVVAGAGFVALAARCERAPAELTESPIPDVDAASSSGHTASCARSMTAGTGDERK